MFYFALIRTRHFVENISAVGCSEEKKFLCEYQLKRAEMNTLAFLPTFSITLLYFCLNQKQTVQLMIPAGKLLLAPSPFTNLFSFLMEDGGHIQQRATFIQGCSKRLPFLLQLTGNLFNLL